MANTARNVHVSAELRDMITALTAARPASPLTLHDVRIAVQQDTSLWSQEGELLHPQDRTALLIEIDQIIEMFGKQHMARDLLTGETG
jgi:hypothetical protein